MSSMGGGSSVAQTAEGAFLLDGMGTYHRAITTSSADAQTYFDQGLRLTFGFNHDEATRSFAKAAELDPTCAICFWGVGLSLGPNYNVPMMPERAKTAWDAVQKAVELAPKASPVEQALIKALSVRYKGPEGIDPVAQQPFNLAYANAMREAAKQFPADDDVQVLFAESLMNLDPWKLWTKDGKPAPQTPEIVSTLEMVLARNPNHPGANHYYIHAVEASSHPEKAVAAAERVGGMMMGAGHLVHMPSHIWQRIGRYDDAVEANKKAAASDLAYLAKTKPPGYYAMYLGHNFGFLAFAACYEGRSADAVEAARKLDELLTPDVLGMMPGMDYFATPKWMVLARFGRWDDILAEPAPDAKYLILRGHWLYAHGLAQAAKGKLADADADLAALETLRAGMPADLTISTQSASGVLAVAEDVLGGEIALRRGKKADAIKLLQAGVAAEDGLDYTEPDYWFYPVRHYLGAALLAAGKAKDAEAVYRADLARHPHNGWALFGLHQALLAQPAKRRQMQTTDVEHEAAEAWAHADVRLTSSAF